MNKPKTFEELLEGKVCLSLINEPPQPVEPGKSYSAREIARKHWGMEVRERPRPGVASQSELK